ncbi:hypothetical protein K437DRAFT_250941 [Tilletiaria anomala UBC 951]|uniref:Uncharacterized protein n=1 Tax=Tilletiaria anomala (strain ATCC 24038 / CBS 436.72 / UBC 951) TaxID=1037660 RepID=A0A066VKJ0_TILAU|nr:uncharacterized protein K437DRAFT_250941 [Tilletiaria anomala UBC 951]KDN39095.1 hypothetical protein K437DRAFT_250941 [Tilletiaria anomala UBC 951]
MASRPTTRTSSRVRGLAPADSTVSAAATKLTRNAAATASKGKASLIEQAPHGKAGTSKTAVSGSSRTGLTMKSVNNAAGAAAIKVGQELHDITNNDRSSRSGSASTHGSQQEGKGKATAASSVVTKRIGATGTTATTRDATSTRNCATGVRRPATSNTVNSTVAPSGATRAVRSRRAVEPATARTMVKPAAPGPSRLKVPAGSALQAAQPTASSATATTAKADQTAQRGLKRPGSQSSLRDATTDKHAVAAKKAKVEKPPKDAGWEDLDKDDFDDPLMVAEYVNEIFDYMKSLEVKCLPNGDYIDGQEEITWAHRSMLVDWLISLHSKLRLVPETLFLAVNIVDRLLSVRHVGLSKLQLVGCTAIFIAAKYEEVMCPSVENFPYLSDSTYTESEILAAERYVLRTLDFNLSYANPMNFLRRISKADDYDIQTRTVAKYFMEIAAVDYRLIGHPPSVIAAAAVWLSREVLERGRWSPTLIHYSSFSEEELLSTAEIMLDYCLRPSTRHPHFQKKYSGKKFMRAGPYVLDWARRNFGDNSIHDDGEPTAGIAPTVDLFAFVKARAERDHSCGPVPKRPDDKTLKEIFGILAVQRAMDLHADGDELANDKADDELNYGSGEEEDEVINHGNHEGEEEEEEW